MHKPTALGLLQEWDFTRMCQVWPAQVGLGEPSDDAGVGNVKDRLSRVAAA